MYSPESMAELRPGATVGRFRLEREVARGGMGTVWAARDPRAPGRLVAVKTVLTAKNSSKLSQLFVEEARIARAVRHPNLVELYDAGEDAGVPYLAMEWVEGLTLRALATSPGELPLGVVLRICMEACDGLHAVHEARTDDGTPLQIVHRDVSPHNLLVNVDGRVKVIDFGIAKARGRLSSETTDGVLRGKVRYMSPEHARGLPLDRRADIWSLGVTLLEVTTGKLPFSGDHDVAMLVQLLSAEPNVPDDPRLPPQVKQIIERALQRKADDRYPNARAMATDLEAAIASLGGKVTRRDVAECVRMRVESAPTQAIHLPNLDLDGDEDGAATALFTMPKKVEPSSTHDTGTSPVRSTAVAARLDTATAPRLPDHEELSEEDLTNIRSIDIMIPSSRSIRPPADSVPSIPTLPVSVHGPRVSVDGTSDTETTAPMRLAFPGIAPPTPSTTPRPRLSDVGDPEASTGEPAPEAPRIPAPFVAKDEGRSDEPNAHPPKESEAPEGEEPDVIRTGPSVGSLPSWETASQPKPARRTHRRLVPFLAFSFVLFFLIVVGLVVSVGIWDEDGPSAAPQRSSVANPAPKPTADPYASEAIAIDAVRRTAPVAAPDASATAKPKR